ncbi:MAG: HAD-IIB family hydrolase [Cytophagales bacterium]|nr:HAD-IIB family hydrolase [Cytophagales bacterium]
MKKLLFTDLDGTMLDLKSYSPDKVKESVAILKKAGVSIIFCSSKTWAEQESYLKELELNEPVIVENGSGIFFPDHINPELDSRTEIIHGKKALVLGKKYDDVVAAIENSAENSSTAFKYYRNQTIEEIASITELSLEAAGKAKSRDFSETIFNANLESPVYTRFEQTLNFLGFQCIPGSRYITVTGIGCNKGTAVKMLVEFYKQKSSEIKSIGIGDSRNDLEMLEVVQFPYLVKRPDNGWVNIECQDLIKISAIGPEGWNIMAREVLAD